MARGWESKAVEDQIAAAEERKAAQGKPTVGPEERDARNRTAGLRLMRAKILADLEKAKDDRHRAMLRGSLAFVESQLTGD